jgi:hypothetical protein
MPLLDHHRPPLKHRLPWSSLHSGLLTELTAALNTRLPAGFIALDSVHLGPAAEIDIATYEVGASPDAGTDSGYRPPPPVADFPFEYAAATELRVYLGDGPNTLVGAIELVSPSNKDRPGSRRAFASKVADYLYAGVSVVVLDTVTDRHANLHDELVDLIAAPRDLKFPADSDLYAVAYRPTKRNSDPRIDVWKTTFRLGDPLPTMPLRLTGDLFVPVDFEAAYMEACRKRKLLP